MTSLNLKRLGGDDRPPNHPYSLMSAAEKIAAGYDDMTVAVTVLQACATTLIEQSGGFVVTGAEAVWDAANRALTALAEEEPDANEIAASHLMLGMVWGQLKTRMSA